MKLYGHPLKRVSRMLKTIGQWSLPVK
jgi:hypothetical protein